MSDTSVNNKRIAKNTLYMYLRMLVMLFVSLYTTRINYQALGIDNFGIYNVVGSIIVFFTFINSGLTTATRRYITAELAQGNEESQRNVFNLSLWAHVLIASVIIVIGETIGLWAVNSLLNIPDDRMFAANVVYQLSVFTAVINVMQAPYTAVITANERMNIYAYISIFEIMAKLGVAYALLYIAGDKLIIYAVLLTITSTLVILINRIYCHHCFAMCRFQRPHSRHLLKEMFGYMGWNLSGQLMIVLTNQGVSVLVNIFYAVAANAAMGVSNQITQIINGFVSNFQIAFHPQITKQYVSQKWEDLNLLAIRSARYSCFLVLIFLVPVCCQINFFLTIWLGDYPLYSVEFCVLTLFCIYIEAISAPFWMILCSDKNVKKYQITISSINAFNFIGSFCALQIGFPPYSVIIVRLIVGCIIVVARLILIRERVSSFPIREWIIKVLLRSGSIMAIPLVFYYFIRMIQIDNALMSLFIKSGIVFVITGITIFFCGLEHNERLFLLKKIHICK